MKDKENRLLKAFMKNQGTIQAVSYAICRDYHLVEDIMQEAIVTILKKQNEFDEARPFLPWALQITRLKTLETLRRHSQNKRLLISEDTAKKLQETIIEELQNSSVEKRTEAMVFCLQQLKPEHRKMMRLKYFEKVKVEVIAQKLKKSFSSTQSQILRLRQKLRKCIEGKVSYE